MARAHPDLPKKVASFTLDKRAIFDAVREIDNDPEARNRVLAMETDFRKRIDTHITGLPVEDAEFKKFNTSPFVLMFYSRQKGYQFVSQIEKDIVPAKVFSSMETSAGRMVETVVLPFYGWSYVPSQMHTTESVIDGRQFTPGSNVLRLATLKSGPRCLNDEMARDIGVDILTHVSGWAQESNVSEIDFTYGVLYGTKQQSNKKDWHILRNMAERLPPSATIHTTHKNSWCLSYTVDGLKVTTTVRVGHDWWSYLGGEKAYLEICAALIRACVAPSNVLEDKPNYIISDLGDIVSLETLAEDYNVSILQRSQFQWLLFIVRHFCDAFYSPKAGKLL